MPSLAVQLMLVNGVVWVRLVKGIEESTVSTATRELLGTARFATLIWMSGLPLIAMPLPSSADFILKETSPITAPPGPMVSITPGSGPLFILNFAAIEVTGKQLNAVSSSMQRKRDIGVNRIRCVVFVPLNTTVYLY